MNKHHILLLDDVDDNKVIKKNKKLVNKWLSIPKTFAEHLHFSQVPSNELSQNLVMKPKILNQT